MDNSSSSCTCVICINEISLSEPAWQFSNCRRLLCQTCAFAGDRHCKQCRDTDCIAYCEDDLEDEEEYLVALHPEEYFMQWKERMTSFHLLEPIQVSLTDETL